MHVWTLHPKYLGRRDLKIAWRDGMKALKVLTHPRIYTRFRSDLSVFRTQSEPVFALVRYLQEIAKEGAKRGLDMDVSKLPEVPSDFRLKIPVSTQRLRSDNRLLVKHFARLGSRYARRYGSIRASRTHPLFFLHTNNKPDAWELLGRIRLKR